MAGRRYGALSRADDHEAKRVRQDDPQAAEPTLEERHAELMKGAKGAHDAIKALEAEIEALTEDISKVDAVRSGGGTWSERLVARAAVVDM